MSSSSPFPVSFFLLLSVLCVGPTVVAFAETNANNNNNNLNSMKNIKTTRGSNYGALNNCTIPTAQEAALRVGVQPPLDVSGRVWKRAWVIHRRALPLLHAADPLRPPETSLNLMCLWWKALAANDAQSPAHDEGLAYDMLPRWTRVVVGPKLQRFYPRLHHTNVEIRTAFLDQSVESCAQRQREQQETKKPIRLISLGAGYDTRSIKLRERGVVDKAIELDLPTVIDAKLKILQSKRLARRRPQLTPDLLPEFHPVNLNELDMVEETLRTILLRSHKDDSVDESGDYHNILLFEAVMIYLDEGVPRKLLEITSRVLRECGYKDGTLIFADRLENVPSGDPDIGRAELESAGWNVVDWKPKPGLARHMGIAELKTQ